MLNELNDYLVQRLVGQNFLDQQLDPESASQLVKFQFEYESEEFVEDITGLDITTLDIRKNGSETLFHFMDNFISDHNIESQVRFYQSAKNLIDTEILLLLNRSHCLSV